MLGRQSSQKEITKQEPEEVEATAKVERPPSHRPTTWHSSRREKPIARPEQPGDGDTPTPNEDASTSPNPRIFMGSGGLRLGMRRESVHEDSRKTASMPDILQQLQLDATTTPQPETNGGGNDENIIVKDKEVSEAENQQNQTAPQNSTTPDSSPEPKVEGKNGSKIVEISKLPPVSDFKAQIGGSGGLPIGGTEIVSTRRSGKLKRGPGGSFMARRGGWGFPSERISGISGAGVAAAYTSPTPPGGSPAMAKRPKAMRGKKRTEGLGPDKDEDEPDGEIVNLVPLTPVTTEQPRGLMHNRRNYGPFSGPYFNPPHHYNHNTRNTYNTHNSTLIFYFYRKFYIGGCDGSAAQADNGVP